MLSRYIKMYEVKKTFVLDNVGAKRDLLKVQNSILQYLEFQFNFIWGPYLTIIRTPFITLDFLLSINHLDRCCNLYILWYICQVIYIVILNPLMGPCVTNQGNWKSPQMQALSKILTNDYKSQWANDESATSLRRRVTSQRCRKYVKVWYPYDITGRWKIT